MGRLLSGDVEHFVLVAILLLGGESYAVPVVAEIESRTGRKIAKAAVYIALRRLEEKGLLTSRLGDPTPARGGKAKRFFAITKSGARQLRDARAAFEQMWDGADELVREAAR